MASSCICQAISTRLLVCHHLPVSNVLLWIPQPSCKQPNAINSSRRKQHVCFYKHPWRNVFCPQKPATALQTHTSLTNAQFPCNVTPPSSAHSNPFGACANIWRTDLVYTSTLGLLDFYKLRFPAQNFYPKRSGTMNSNQRRWMSSYFGRTYVCEQFFLKMKQVKSDLQTALTTRDGKAASRFQLFIQRVA
jgi:hypothetical protein